MDWSYELLIENFHQRFTAREGIWTLHLSFPCWNFLCVSGLFFFSSSFYFFLLLFFTLFFIHLTPIFFPSPAGPQKFKKKTKKRGKIKFLLHASKLMDLRRNINLILLLVLLGHHVKGENVVFNVKHKFGGRGGVSLKELKAHDVHRHGRMLGAADFQLGGNGSPTSSVLVPFFIYSYIYVYYNM